jgi:hypothetical protein
MRTHGLPVLSSQLQYSCMLQNSCIATPLVRMVDSTATKR